MICPHCSNEVVEGQRFCPKCGRRLDAAAPAAAQPRSGGPSWTLFFAVIILAGLGYGGFRVYSYYKMNAMLESGTIAYKTKNHAQCIKGLRYVVGRNVRRSTEPRLMLAECYVRDRNAKAAYEQLEDAASWAPDDVRIPAQWARFLYNDGKYQSAFEKAGAAIKLDPDNSVANQYMFLSLLRLGDYEGAQKYLAPAKKGADDEQIIVLYNALADDQYRRGDSGAAIHSYEKSIEAYPNQFDVLYRLAVLYEKREDYDECYDYSKRARRLAGRLDKKGWDKAEKLERVCGSVVKTLGLEMCFEKRRKIDRRFFYTLKNFLDFYKEVMTEPEEFIGEPNEKLESLLGQAKKIETDYAKVSCPTDDESNNFRQSLIMVRGVVVNLTPAVQSFSDYLEAGDQERYSDCEMALKRLNDQINQAINIWKAEEKRFGFEPIVPEKKQETKEKKPPAADGGNGTNI